ncbi:endolytic transglycosylase MltG [Thermotalea metallivorans]|uniref:endolytic transglycosylase MltG n=1 Tax=Thermotalea metallivorans TaxID=520762 RepID=UPI0012ED412F|nr:endolytic transglycosylase MltG [Thermotalea metallivorans]
MKNRILWVWMLGIGIGIIISSSLNVLTQPKITEDFIRREARKLGMIDPKDYFDKSAMEKQKESPSQEKRNDLAFPAANHRITIKIPKGTTSKEIAKILKENRLIVSEENFLNKVYAKGMTGKIRWGKYEFSSDSSEDEIIEKIINGDFE